MSPANYPTLRLNSVVFRLQKFGITARDGHGSEMVLEGKKQTSKSFSRFIVGRHAANREIPKELLKAILRRFEIDIKIFFAEIFHS